MQNSFRYYVSMGERAFLGAEYLAALRQHYPELVDAGSPALADRVLHVGIIEQWSKNVDRLGIDAPNRFQRMGERPWMSERSAWLSSGLGASVRYAGVRLGYKGLINLKTAIDLVLYSALIWELQPHTILEFGSLQGGSALWYADQLETLCGRGEVHSFELCVRCISPRAEHPRLTFHYADLRRLETLDEGLLAGFPHPWLVVDDAHENLLDLLPFIARLMKPGDYYVIEDVFHYHSQRVGEAFEAFDADEVANLCETLGFLVDSKYADAFGINVTASPNAWLTMSSRSTPRAGSVAARASR
jgi:cephalosporin hydroxylase